MGKLFPGMYASYCKAIGNLPQEFSGSAVLFYGLSPGLKNEFNFYRITLVGGAYRLGQMPSIA